MGQRCARPGNLYHSENNTKEALDSYAQLQAIIYRYVTESSHPVTVQEVLGYFQESNRVLLRQLDETDIRNLWQFNRRLWIDGEVLIPRPPSPLPRFWTIGGVALTLFVTLMVLFCA